MRMVSHWKMWPVQRLTASYCGGEAKNLPACERCSAMAASGLCGRLQSGICSNMDVYSEAMA